MVFGAQAESVDNTPNQPYAVGRFTIDAFRVYHRILDELDVWNLYAA